MGSPALIVRTAQSAVLYDTSKSVYGLVKSGPVELVGVWLKSGSGFADNMYRFVVKNAKSPIVFTFGTCGKPFQSKEGNDIVFYFASLTETIRVYAFDLMQPIFNGPALKTRDVNEKFTFNSLQWPLNIVGTSEPPPPTREWSPLPGGSEPSWAVGGFVGGSAALAMNEATPVSGTSGWQAGFRFDYYDRLIDSTKNFAAYIPWNRGCARIGQTGGAFNNMRLYGEEEGCSGINGGYIRHLFWSSPETPYTSANTQWQQGLYSLTVSPRPTSMLIDISEYPYPFDPLA